MRNLAIALSLCFVAACHSRQTATSTTATVDEHAHDATSTTSGATAEAPAAVAHAGTRVELTSPVPGASGYLSLPKAEGKRPAIIVIQEWWGLNDWIKESADRLASQGYVTLAVDLYRGRVATDQETAHELSRALPEDRAIGDLKAAFNYLAARGDVDPGRIGVIGWCMGGGYALGLASAEPRLKGAVINYGRLITDPATIAKIQPPLLGNFGGKDKGIPPEDVKTFTDTLKAAGREADVKIYDDAGHAFMNPNNKSGYNAAAAEDAWKRIDAFFANKLKG